jgi:hypothetical protein
MKRSILLVLALPVLLLAACGDDSNNNNSPKDAPLAQLDAGGTDASCFTNPTTYNEIINACTDSVKVFKDSHPPLLNSDGTVPPLPTP